MTTRLDPATRSRVRVLVSALPFAIIAAIGVSRMVIGPGGACFRCWPWARPWRQRSAAWFIPWPRVRWPWRSTGYSLSACNLALASRARERRDRVLAHVQLVAEAAQQVLLRPVPRPADPVRLAAGYLSASSGARVGGDLYEVVTTPECVRLVVGDAKGKGLPAVRSAAAVLGVFREAAHKEDGQAAIVSHIETSLAASSAMSSS